MSIGKLETHDLRSVWRNEAMDFTVWLAENLDRLSSTLDMELTLKSREHKVGPFSVDIFAEDGGGQNVIIENQLEQTDHKHLGQLIVYATNLKADTVIWISSEPRTEHVNAVNWLNRETQINFYLLKLTAISIDGSRPAPVFQIICRPDQGLRDAVVGDRQISERNRFNKEFWTEFNVKCKQRLPLFVHRKPPTSSNHVAKSGLGGLSFVCVANSEWYGVELYINTSDKDLNESICDQLEQDRHKIEKEFGANLEFQLLPDKRASRVRYKIKEGADVMDLDRDKVQIELIDCMVRFEKILKPRLRKLSLEDDVP